MTDPSKESKQENQHNLVAPNYTQIPNVVFDYWLPRLKPSEFTVLLCLCRKLFGWHKTSDFISVSQIVKATGLTKNTALKSIESLIEHGLVLRQHHSNERGNHPNEYALNIEKPVDDIYQSTPIRSKFGGGSAKIAPGVVQKLHPQKKDYTKERKDISKDISKSPEPDGSSHPPPKSEDSRSHSKKSKFADAKDLSYYQFKKIRESHPKAKIPNFEKWIIDMEKLLRIDKVPKEEVREMLNWIFDVDDFWYKNILSPGKLRKKWDILAMNRIEKKKKEKHSKNLNKQTGKIFKP